MWSVFECTFLEFYAFLPGTENVVRELFSFDAVEGTLNRVFDKLKIVGDLPYSVVRGKILVPLGAEGYYFLQYKKEKNPLEKVFMTYELKKYKNK